LYKNNFTTTQIKQKAKRKINSLDFTGKNAAVALVSKDQGGAANGVPTLFFKAANFSDEFVSKAQQVRVTLELPDFLRKFFGLYYEDAEVLAAMMGYKRPELEVETEDYYEDYIESKLASFEILKSLHESDNLTDTLSTLDEDEYLSMLKDQALVEKALKKIEKAEKAKVKSADTTESGTVATNAVEPDNSTTASVEKTVEASASLNKGKLMPKTTDEPKVIEQEVTVEMIEKSAFEQVQKALDEQKVQLEKAMQTIAAFEQEKKEQIVKAKTSKVQAVVKSEKQLAVVLKAALALEDEKDFDAFVEVLNELQSQIEKSALFQEQGASAPAAEVKDQESAVARILKSQFSK
jgi:hypothetical protein